MEVDDQNRSPATSGDADAAPARLEYESPLDRHARDDRPSAVVAAIACIPGALCWTILLASAVIAVAPRRLPRFPPAAMVAAAFGWVFVLVGGLIAIALYVDRPNKPWYVILSLAINISGLAITLLLFCLLLYPNS